jgi:hypothetical protein
MRVARTARGNLMKPRIMVALAASVLAGCSGIPEGTHEQIKVYTHPGRADCALNRQGKVIGRIEGTPGFTTVEKTWHDLTIRCSKAGFKDAVYRIRGGAAGIFFDKPVPRADTASDDVNAYGAMYDVVVNLTLHPKDASVPDTAPTPAAAKPSGTISILGK